MLGELTKVVGTCVNACVVDLLFWLNNAMVNAGSVHGICINQAFYIMSSGMGTQMLSVWVTCMYIHNPDYDGPLEKECMSICLGRESGCCMRSTDESGNSCRKDIVA